MKIRTKAVFIAAFFFIASLIGIMLYAVDILEREQARDGYHLENHITQLVTMVTKPYLESHNLPALQSVADEIVQQPGIVYLMIEKGSDILAHSHIPPNPTEPITTTTLSIRNESMAGVKALVGFQGAHFEPATTSYGKLVIYCVIGISMLAVGVNLYLVIAAFRPLHKLQQYVLSKNDLEKQSSPGFLEDVDGTVEMVIKLQEQLQKSHNQLYNSLRGHQYSYSEAREIEEQSEAIYKASHDAIIVANDQDIIIEFSPVAEQIFGWERDDIVGCTMSDTIIPPAMRDMHIKGMQHFLKTGEGPVLDKRVELTAIRRSGREFPIEISISAAQTAKGHIFVSYIRDITQRLNDQTELKIASRAFETSQPVFIADNKGHIIRTNPAFSAVTGYSITDVEGEKPRYITANADDATFHTRIWNILNSQGSWEGEIQLRHKKGKKIPVFMSITSVTDEKNTLSHYVVHFFDLSEQKQNEQILLEAQRNAENANHAKSRFLAAMSHEIRTPMNGVLGVLGLLKETELNELQYKLVRTARESGELLLAIINDILDFSKMEAGKLSLENTPFDMLELFEQTIDIVYPQAEKKNLTLQSHIIEGVPQYLEGDGDRIRQVMLNLLSNAVKYTKRGSIQVIMKSLHRHPHSVKLQLDVIDTGIGVEQKHIPTLFDEFTMAEGSYNRSHEGSGLGLAICKQLVNLMDGDISVHSVVGKGSTFTVTMLIKVADNINATPLPVTKTDHIDISKDFRILMAEDNPANQVVLRTMLEFAGLPIDIVSNGQEAVEAVSIIPYDIVLMDISMPGMDGMEATKRIRALPSPAKDVVIVALTAHALRGDREHFINLGMDDFISKPVSKHSLLECLARWQPKPPPSLDEGWVDNASKKEATDTLADSEPSHETPHVDEATLTRLAADTSPDVVPSLIEFYIQDARVRVQKIVNAASANDYYALEFEAHTLGSGAAAHGNAMLSQQCRQIEHCCLAQDFEHALKIVETLTANADTSFSALDVFVNNRFVLKADGK